MSSGFRRLLESKIEAEKDVKMKELALMILLSEEQNYQRSQLQKELFELLKAKYVVDLELARWEVKNMDDTIGQTVGGEKLRNSR